MSTSTGSGGPGPLVGLHLAAVNVQGRPSRARPAAGQEIRKTAAKSRKRVTSHRTVETLAAVDALRAAMSNNGRLSVANDNK
jgi:hypothetical protein